MHNLCGDTGKYSSLRRDSSNKGYEVHHILEKRFRAFTDYSTNGSMPSIVLDKSQHRIYTNAWRKEVPYASSYDLKKVVDAAYKIYADNEKLLEITLKALGVKK